MIGRYTDDLTFLLSNVSYIADINITNGNSCSYRSAMIDLDLPDKGQTRAAGPRLFHYVQDSWL